MRRALRTARNWFRWHVWYRLRPIYSMPWCIYKAEHGRYPLVAWPWATRRRVRLDNPGLDVTRVVGWRYDTVPPCPDLDYWWSEGEATDGGL